MPDASLLEDPIAPLSPGARLSGQVAVVVGAGQTPGETIGNGRASAIAYAREGARVVLVDRRPDSAAETAALIGEATGDPDRARVVTADVTREADCEAMVGAALDAFGRIDILHNNVGRSEGDAPTPELPVEVWEALVDLNLKSFFLTSKHVLPAMRAAGRGVITNISSIASVCSMPTLAYPTTKAGVNALTRHLAIENAGHGIRVNAILPGLMDTPMAIERRAREQGVERAAVREQRHRRVPLGRRMGSAWDVAHAAVFLASAEARFITGVLLPVDGGQTARVG